MDGCMEFSSTKRAEGTRGYLYPILICKFYKEEEDFFLLLLYLGERVWRTRFEKILKTLHVLKDIYHTVWIHCFDYIVKVETILT